MRTAREIPARVVKTDRTRYHAVNVKKALEEKAPAAFSHSPLQARPSARPRQAPPELRRLSAADLHFKIWHRFRAPGTECAPGEEVAAVAVSFGSRQREFHLPLSLALRLVFDLLARHRHVPLSASQIAASFRSDAFYRKHGCNALKNGTLIRRVSRSSVRVYIDRICRALALSFEEAHLRIDPREVLVSQETVTNEVGYRLRGTFEWVHTDHPGREFEYLR